jgi:hypothetical protein
MVEPGGGCTFPFGRPVLRRKPSAKSRRRVFVLGAYPSALHIAWWSPHRKLVKALAVDNEPAAFWAAEDERAQIDAWRALVHFRVGAWGEVETAETNGKAGRWVDEHVLAPLGVTRDEACLSTCVDTYHHADPGIAFGVDERYQAFAREAGLPEARLQRRPREGAFVELAATEHRERLLKELSVVVPEIVVTLGVGPFRVLRAITDQKVGRRLRPDATYGVEQPLTVGGRTTRWLALCATEPSAEYAEVHARWREGRGG